MCKQEERIIQLERKIEYLERIIMALAKCKVSKEINVVDSKYKNKLRTKDAFEEEMKKIWWSLEEYLWF